MEDLLRFINDVPIVNLDSICELSGYGLVIEDGKITKFE